MFFHVGLGDLFGLFGDVLVVPTAEAVHLGHTFHEVVLGLVKKLL